MTLFSLGDAVSNRNTNGNTVEATGDNRLLSDETFTYEYDAEGNRTLRTRISSAAADDYTTEYTWDYRNRLTSVTFKNNSGEVTKTVTYTYDVYNRWVGEAISVPGQDVQQTRFVYDGNQIIAQFEKTGTGNLSATDLSHRYLWNPQTVDQLFADEQTSSLPSGQGYDLATPGEVLWALTDHENTIRDLATYDAQTNQTTIANHRAYDSFGNLKSETNSAIDYLFGYTGRPLDTATGLQNNLNRWYDSLVGRWLSRDPIGSWAGETNFYRYVENNALDCTDPSGLFSYRQGRELGGKKPAILGRTDLSHEYIVTIDPRTGERRTYSWGNEGNNDKSTNPSHWYKNRKEDLAASKDRQIVTGGKKPKNWSQRREAGNELDPYIDQAYRILQGAGKDSPSAHPNGGVGRNCKTEADRLLELAKRLKEADDKKNQDRKCPK